MDFEKGYRIRLSEPDTLPKLLSSYRTYAMRILAASMAETIAKSAVSALDASRIGLGQSHADFLQRAKANFVASEGVTLDGVFARRLNCCIDFYFVGSAVFSVMSHGSDRYRKPWESKKEVVKWGWSPSAERPQHISEKSWSEREQFWTAVSKLASSPYGSFRFDLLNEQLPEIGWPIISKALPSYSWRLENCVRRLATADGRNLQNLHEKDRLRYEERASAALIRDISRESFSTKVAKTKISQVAQKVEEARPIEPKQRQPRKDIVDELATTIDHADLVIASDGRPFLAVPHVGFRPEDRIFVQVGSKYINFSQNGIQFGTVTDIPVGSRDYLRQLTSLTLVEVKEVNGKRLLRAKHTAIVSDISVSEGLRRPLQTFVARKRDIGLGDLG